MQLHFPEEVQTAAAVPEKGLSGRFIKHGDCRRGQTASGQKPTGTNVPAGSACRKSLFAPLSQFSELYKVLKTIDFNGAGHPSWVSRAHPSLPPRKTHHFIDSLSRQARSCLPAFSGSLIRRIFRGCGAGRKSCEMPSYIPSMMCRISTSVWRIPCRARRPTLAMVCSTSAPMMPSPSAKPRPDLAIS